MQSSAARAIDFNHLDAYTAGDQDLIREVLRLFRGHVAQSLTVLESAADQKSMKDAAHGIKGAARGIGAWAVAEAASDIEKTDFHDTDAKLNAFAQLKAMVQLAAIEIDRELA